MLPDEVSGALSRRDRLAPVGHDDPLTGPDPRAQSVIARVVVGSDRTPHMPGLGCQSWIRLPSGSQQ